jgi:hypothetical protein
MEGPMPVNIKELFKENGINIMLDGAKGVGVPVTDALIEKVDMAELSDVIGGHNIVAGDMLTATIALDENGEPKLGANGRPKRAGGYIKLGVDNNLLISIPRAEAGADPYFLNARNSRDAAATLLRMAREARFDVAKIEEEYEEAMAAYNADVEDGVRAEEPVKRTPEFLPETFTRYEPFITAAEAVIAAEVNSAFSSVNERKSELMASLSIRNEQRKTLSPEQLEMVAEARSLKEQIAKLNPDHPLAQRSLTGTYTGDGKASAKAVEALRTGPIGIYFSKGIPKMGPAAELVDPLVASFTMEKPENVYKASLSGSQRRRFEQEIGRFENKEIGAVLKTQIDGVMNEWMRHYSCDTKFFTHQGVDMLMVADVESQQSSSVFLYVMDAEARSMGLDIEALNRPATEEDVPTEDALVELRTALTELAFNNDEDIDFDEPDLYDEDDFEDEDLENEDLEGEDLDDPDMF